jgi:3-hydroxyacyl-CoA dehydrogenase
MAATITRVAIIGTGVIGASWASLFLAKGLDVVATDVAPDAQQKLQAFVEATWPTLEQAGLSPGASPNRLHFTKSVDDAIAAADLVQENGPERIEFKQDLYRHLDEALGPETIIASSSSGLTMSAIQSVCAHHPERCLIAHPFNPPHLIPLVEIVGGTRTSEEAIDRATTFYRGLGKRTIRLRKEVPGHVANRLQAALFREVVHLIADDVVSVGDADAAVSWGPGLRWGIMGPSLLYHLGGGEGGIEHFFEQFTGPLTAWWHVLGTPELTEEVCAKIISGVHDEVRSRTIEDLVEYRDGVLGGLLALRRKELDAERSTPGI